MKLEGLMYGYGGPLVEADRKKHRFISNVVGSQFVTVDAATGEEPVIEGAVTNEEGEAVLSFCEPGRYYVSATGGFCRYNSDLTRPWLEAVVVA